VIAKQLVLSGTSVGANYPAATRARSPADFAAKTVPPQQPCENLAGQNPLGDGVEEEPGIDEGLAGPLAVDGLETCVVPGEEGIDSKPKTG